MSRPFRNSIHANQLQLPSFPPLTPTEDQLLDTLVIPPFNQSLRVLALKVHHYGNIFEEAGIHLRTDLARLEVLGNEFTALNGQNINGTEVVVLGDPRATQNSVNIHTYTKNHDTLLALVEQADEYLAAPGPYEFEEYFKRSTVALGALLGLDGYLSEFSFKLKKSQMYVYTRYTTILQQAAPVQPPVFSPHTRPYTPLPASSGSVPQHTVTAQEPNWFSSTDIPETSSIQSWVFRYNFSPDPEYCIWKVVGSEESDPTRGLPAKFNVAFDWREPHETKEMMIWEDVCGLIMLPTSERYHRGGHM